MSEEMDVKAEETDPLQKTIALQTFEGYWSLNIRLLEAVGLSAQHQPPPGSGPEGLGHYAGHYILGGKDVRRQRGMGNDGRESWRLVEEYKRRGGLGVGEVDVG